VLIGARPSPKRLVRVQILLPLPITYPAAPADVGGNVLAKCEAAMMVRLLMSQDRELYPGSLEREVSCNLIYEGSIPSSDSNKRADTGSNPVMDLLRLCSLRAERPSFLSPR
jgi:hypothetical protein